MAEADTIGTLAQIETGDKIKFGDRKQPLEVTSHNRKMNGDGLDGFYCTVEGSRGGKYKLDTKKLHRDSPYFQIYRLDEGILENEWQKNGRASIDSFQLVEKGDYEYSEEEQHLLSFDIGQKVHLDLGNGETATGTVNRFEVSSRTVSLWVRDDEQDPDKNYSNTYSISPPDVINDHINARFHPDEFQADTVKYDQVTVSDTPVTPNHTDPDTDPEVATDGGEDVIDQLLDLEAGDDIVITADGRDLHGQVVDHFVERYESAGGYGELMIDIELAERHVDGETIKAYGLSITATEKRSGWVHFHAAIAHPTPDSEHYDFQDMTPITNVRMEREDEFPRDLDRDDEGYPEGVEEFQLLGIVPPGKGARVAVSSNAARDTGLQMAGDVDLEAIDGVLDSRTYTENGTTVGWVCADAETGEIIEIWIDDQYLKDDPDYSACSHQIVAYSHRGTGSYRLATSGDQPEIMADGGCNHEKVEYQYDQQRNMTELVCSDCPHVLDKWVGDVRLQKGESSEN